MKSLKTIVAIATALSLGACASTDLASRDVPMASDVGTAGASYLPSAEWTLRDVRVNVPETLPTTEADVYYPMADIVWHGDPVGNRHQQVQRLMDDGLTAGLSGLRGGRPVFVDVEVVRFHSLSPKTRNSIGGVHNMLFDMEVRDANTGEVLVPRQRHKVDLRGYGGRRALKAERNGQGQKVRIMAHLQNWVADTLSVPQAMRVTPGARRAAN
ncbi:hypothetical protein BV394_00975 [Brevirhabdus pacifica]|uniref:Uncharacterized protein n=1 Tax=Brevirhabdus pacifica TaxID=1267768 RepID=A0A1U7DEV3_9RHOB|nr:DUF6778 family protein [Brevirhabdus pacifica]APX88475.1 hypothetical protein BV394_00975 [Brevirhabdus pacifica]PJJ87052.1 hypothetical protein CLV77_1616 [Brevirhabdus pacifica]